MECALQSSTKNLFYGMHANTNLQPENLNNTRTRSTWFFIKFHSDIVLGRKEFLRYISLHMGVIAGHCWGAGVRTASLSSNAAGHSTAFMIYNKVRAVSYSLGRPLQPPYF